MKSYICVVFWLLSTIIDNVYSIGSFPLSSSHQVILGGGQIVDQTNPASTQDGTTAASKLSYEAQYIQVPVDHFHNDTKYEPHSNAKFPLRYWFDASHYRFPGPVIVLLAGEASGEERLPILRHGILHQLSESLNGIGVVLEHRYYGDSFPTDSLSVESLRFLDTQQALADVAYFAQNVRFKGLEDYALTSKYNPWFAYGGSYAGSMAAFLRVLYPEDFYGAISSSGVPEAIVDYWQYWEAIRIYGPKECIKTTQQFVQLVDDILLVNQHKPKLATLLKKIFGFDNLTPNEEFAAIITMTGVGRWQSRNWDPKVNSPVFDQYCTNITSNTLLYPGTIKQRRRLEYLIDMTTPLIDDKDILVNRTLNWIGYLTESFEKPCDFTVDACYHPQEKSFWEQSDRDSWIWRSWTWQYCTQWGYLTAGSTIPPTISPIISRLITPALVDTPCQSAFGLSALDADVASINQYGGFNISYPRLAFIDGEADPWRWAGTHAPGLKERVDSMKTPWVLIKGAVHHWDENGLPEGQKNKDEVPEPVAQAQGYEVEFMKAWLDGGRESVEREA